MSLYDDFDTRERAEKVAGWSSGIKLLQSQLQLKKATIAQPKKDTLRKTGKILAPVIDLKSRRDDEDIYPASESVSKPVSEKPPAIPSTCSQLNIDYNLDIVDEYNPLFPNEYEKVIKELRDYKDKERGRDDSRNDDNDRDVRKNYNRKRKTRFEEGNSNEPEKSGFAPHNDVSDEESPPRQPRNESIRNSGAQIAPPPSLLESVETNPTQIQEKPSYGAPYGASSVAAKIMAKYGFKEGQGLGKSQQGMSMALQVEKTSKRGGRIIHEKELSAVMPPPALSGLAQIPQGDDSPTNATAVNQQPKQEPSITEIMRSPSKVVLLRNMVGPGDVDADLEPEVFDECNGKYGDVVKVLIHELPGAPPEDAVRIFVEFKRIESAIKAVVDLNGRFFGGRQVRAGFYSCESFANLKLLE